MKSRSLVVANWKMNPQNLLEAKKVFNGIKKSAQGVKNVEVCVCPPFPYLHTFSKLSNPKNFYLGAQDLSSSEKRCPHW